MQITFEQKSEMGFQYILNRLTPSSPYGQEMLRQLEPYQREQRKQLDEDLDNIGKILKKEKEITQLTGEIQRLFMRMKDIRPALKKGKERCLSDIELFELKNFLLYSWKARQAAQQLVQKTGLQGIQYRDTLAALDLLDPDGRRIPSFSVSDRYSEQLREIRKQKRELERRMDQVMEQDEEWDRLKELRKEVVIKEEREEQTIRQKLTEKLQPYFPAMKENARMTGKLDLLLEKVRAAHFAGSVRPEISNSFLTFENAVNPWVASVLKEQGRKFTPLSISLEQGAGVITGANMGGKSVTLQTITLNTLLALCGFYVYASTARVPHFDEIRIISEAAQSVRRGLSSFGAQIIQLRDMVDLVKSRYCFVVMDEFARGTNPEEGAALVRAVTEFLNGQNVVGLLVTHFDHVAEYAKVHYQVAGLKDMDQRQVEREIAVAGRERGVAVIAAHMNYGIFRVDKEADCPRDAFRICSLLGLQREIMELLE